MGEPKRDLLLSGRAALPGRLGRFVLERFPPAAYGPLILAFVMCGYVGAARASGVAPQFDARFLAVSLAMTLVFLRLRVTDELKDAPLDRLGRPERPLPRGLVTRAELRATAAVCVIGEVVLAVALGTPALVAYGAALVYTRLSARDFFLGQHLHRRLVLYAFLHSPIVPLLLAVTWWAHPAARAGSALYGLLLLAWGVSLGLEVARKTVAPAEERPYVETYSGVLGQPRAVRLAAFALATGCLGGAAYAAAVGAPAPGAPGMLGASLVVLLAGSAARHTRRLGALRAAASALGLALLLWPLLIVLLERRAGP